MNDYAKLYGWDKYYPESLLKQNSFSADGKTWQGDTLFGVSQTGEVVGIYYNRQLLSSLGLGVPKTLSRREHRDGGGQGQGRPADGVRQPRQEPGNPYVRGGPGRTGGRACGERTGQSVRAVRGPTRRRSRQLSRSLIGASRGISPRAPTGCHAMTPSRDSARAGLVHADRHVAAADDAGRPWRKRRFHDAELHRRQPGYHRRSGTGMGDHLEVRTSGRRRRVRQLHRRRQGRPELLGHRQPARRRAGGLPAAPGTLAADMPPSTVTSKANGMPYLDYATPTFYDTITSAMQELVAGQQIRSSSSRPSRRTTRFRRARRARDAAPTRAAGDPPGEGEAARRCPRRGAGPPLESVPLRAAGLRDLRRVPRGARSCRPCSTRSTTGTACRSPPGGAVQLRRRRSPTASCVAFAHALVLMVFYASSRSPRAVPHRADLPGEPAAGNERVSHRALPAAGDRVGRGRHHLGVDLLADGLLNPSCG